MGFTGSVFYEKFTLPHSVFGLISILLWVKVWGGVFDIFYLFLPLFPFSPFYIGVALVARGNFWVLYWGFRIFGQDKIGFQLGSGSGGFGQVVRGQVVDNRCV